MRWTRSLIPTLRDDPADAEAISHKLMVRAGLVRQLGLRSVAVAGFSRGGVPAVRLAARHPSTVTALILACPAGLPRSEEEEDVVLPPATARTLLRDRLVGPLLADPACITAEFSALMRRNAQRAARFERLRAIQQPYEPDVSAELPRIHMPCLILWGREDPLMPVSNAFRFQRAITGAELYIFPGLRHLFHYEAAAGFNDRVHSFLAAHDRQPTAGGGPGGAAD